VPGLEELCFPDLYNTLVDPNVSDPESRNLSQAQPGAVCQNQHRIQTAGAEGSAGRRERERRLKELADLLMAEYMRSPLSPAYLPHQLPIQSGNDDRWIFALECLCDDSAHADPRKVQFESRSFLRPSLNQNCERPLSSIRLFL
jgi:hypothetical protein